MLGSLQKVTYLSIVSSSYVLIRMLRFRYLRDIVIMYRTEQCTSLLRLVCVDANSMFVKPHQSCGCLMVGAGRRT